MPNLFGACIQVCVLGCFIAPLELQFSKTELLSLRLLSIIDSDPGQLRSISISSDGDRLFIASQLPERKVNLTARTLPEGRVISRKGLTGGVYKLMACEPSKELVLSPDSGQIAVLDATTLERKLYLPGTIGHAFDLERGKQGVIGLSEDYSIRIWNIGSGLIRHAYGRGYNQSAIACSPDGLQIAYSCKDNAIEVWDAVKKDRLHHLIGHTKVVYSMLFSPDGTILASSSTDESLRLWDLRSGRACGLKCDMGFMAQICFAGNGKVLYSSAFAAGFPGETFPCLVAWEVFGQEKKVYPVDSPIVSLAYNKRRGLLAVGLAEGKVRLYEVPSQRTRPFDS